MTEYLGETEIKGNKEILLKNTWILVEGISHLVPENETLEDLKKRFSKAGQDPSNVSVKTCSIFRNKDERKAAIAFENNPSQDISS